MTVVITVLIFVVAALLVQNVLLQRHWTEKFSAQADVLVYLLDHASKRKEETEKLRNNLIDSTFP